MTSNRPFFSNFLAAFRAHSATLPKPQSSLSTSTASAAAAAQTVWSSQSAAQSTNASGPRSITTKASAAPPTQQTPLHQTLSHNVTPLTHGPRSPPSPGIGVSGGLPVHGPANRPSPSYPTAQEARRARRGSDSSSEGGYRDVLGAEKWYVGGKTSTGEDKYYKLGMVRRDRSADRLSADRLSL